jgi:hypothetical protein
MIYVSAAVSNGKQKPRQFFKIHLQTEVYRIVCKRTKRTRVYFISLAILHGTPSVEKMQNLCLLGGSDRWPVLQYIDLHNVILWGADPAYAAALFRVTLFKQSYLALYPSENYLQFLKILIIYVLYTLCIQCIFLNSTFTTCYFFLKYGLNKYFFMFSFILLLCILAFYFCTGGIRVYILVILRDL